ncbi:MAG: Lrp/AsnC family transcriptional regulator [Clostridiales bacterium]|nr:Lrp/AsnC family transcriptional regulator [Clostridiales bacterium]
MDKILCLLEENSRLTNRQLAAMTDRSEAEVAAALEAYEKAGVVLGYPALIDWDQTDKEYVQAIIELKVTPERDTGFDKVAEAVCKFDEVKSIYLMSGAYDLSLIVEGKTMKDIAFFVAKQLASIDSVTSTATHFIMKKYKDKGVIFPAPEDERDNVN